MVVTNEYGDSAIIKARDDKFMEWLSRGVTIRMGGAAYIAEYSMSGADMKRTSVHNTLSLGIRIGRCLREAKKNHQQPDRRASQFPAPDALFLRARDLARQSDRRSTRNQDGLGAGPRPRSRAWTNTKA